MSMRFSVVMTRTRMSQQGPLTLWLAGSAVITGCVCKQS